MYIDSSLEFSVKQALSAAGASTNVIDLGTPARNIGPGQPMWVIVQTDAAVAADVTVDIETAAAVGFGAATKIASVTVPASTPTGRRFVVGFPYTNQRFLRLNYGAAITATAWLTDQEPQSWDSLPAQT